MIGNTIIPKFIIEWINEKILEIITKIFVEILTKDGKRYFKKIEYPKGDSENPLSWDELIEKFNGLTSSIYSKERQKMIIERLRGIEKAENLRQFVSIL